MKRGATAAVGETPPQNLEAEQSTLGSMLLDREMAKAVLAILDPADFWREVHERIFQAMADLAAREEPIDLVSVVGELRAHSLIGEIGGPVYLTTLMDSVPTPANGEYYARMVLDTSERRQVIADCREISAAALSPNGLDWREAAKPLIYLSGGKGKGKYLAALRKVSQVERTEVHWLWEPRIAYGNLTIIQGDIGIGKTMVACALATATTLGYGLPGGKRGKPANVLLCLTEDDGGSSVRPRLEDMGCDLDRAYIHMNEMAMILFDGDGFARLEAYMEECQPDLVVLDPLTGFVSDKIDINRANHIKPILMRLAALAVKYECAILVLNHITKSGDTRGLHRGLGSIAIAGSARSVILAGQDRETRDRALLHVKSNMRGLAPPIGYKIAEDGCFGWTGDSTLTEEQFFSPPPPEDGTPLAEAVDYLESCLIDGPKPGKDLTKAAHAMGISQRTLERAKGRLKVKSQQIREQSKVGIVGWMWSLPAQEGKS